LSSPEMLILLRDSKHMIKCKNEHEFCQKKAFFSRLKDEKGYYIKCEKCNDKIYWQFRISEKEIIDYFPIKKE
jgi:hypothetical protein